MQKKSILAVLLAACLLAGNLAGCRKEETQQETEEITKPTVLTNVYRGEDIELTEEYYINQYLGVRDGSFVLLASYSHQEGEWDTENYVYEYYPVLCYVPMEGGEPVIQRIEGREYVNSMSLFDGGYMILDQTWDEVTMQTSYSIQMVMDDGTETTLENLSSYFSVSDEYFYLSNAVMDGEGYLYLFADGEIVVLNPEGKKHCSIQTENWIQNVDMNSEGVVYVSYYHYSETGGGGYIFAPVDKTAGTIGEPISLPETIQADSFFFGPVYDLYYYNSTGIYGYTIGDADGTLLMHFENSDITGDLDMVRAVDENRFLLQYYDRITWDRKMGVFTKSADIDLSQIQVIEIATAFTSYDLPTLVVEFNRNHTDARIVTTDYSRYNTDEDYEAGSKKLANDILNGIYSPDIICGDMSDAAYKAVLDNDLFLDLNTYLETDSVLPKSELLGCVLNTYNKDGKIFGLPFSISLETVVANKSLVGDRSGWTVEEMLDFITSLPEDVEFMQGMTQNSAAYLLLGSAGFGNFVDLEAGTCSFDSEAFISYLEYIKTLPKELPDDYYMTMNEDRYGPYKTGKVVADTMYYSGINSFLEEKVYFGEDNIAYIGYPAESGKSGVLLGTYNTVYSVMASSEYPELAWSFIRDAVLQANTFDEMRGGSDGIPMLHSAIEQMKEHYADYTFVVHYDGGMSWGPGFTPDESELKNSEAFQLTEKDWDHIVDFLDTIGAPLTVSTLPADVTAIIDEELSGYLEGTKSAADCAGMIQNRVSLYLAENS